MEFKTLKDIDNYQIEQISKYISLLQEHNCFKLKEKKEVIADLKHQMKLFDLIKKQAIKWVKEDKEDIINARIITPIYILHRWMKRLNIEESNLK